MNFIETLKLRSKLFFLFILITFGLITVAIIGYIQISGMKKNMDSLYFGSLVPVVELHSIMQKYNNNLFYSIHAAAREDLDTQELSQIIDDSLHIILKKWKSYESHFKRYEEMEYVEYAASEIETTNQYFKKILDAVANGQDITTININILEKKISHINGVIDKLLRYEINIAQYERKSFLQNYQQITSQLGIAFLLIIIAVLVISFYVFESIQKDQTQLELTTKKLRRANKKLENVSYTDSLTGLHNRRYFNLVFERELKLAKRNKSYITFMMLDIDFFKQYNDTYGHIEGDYALKSVAKVLKDTLKRPNDYVFRLGGEEFGVLLSDTDESNSAKLAREICDAVKGRELKHEKSTACEFVTISIGVVCCVADDALVDDLLIQRADEMLYHAKESGRNRYIITSNVSEATTKSLEEIEEQIA